MITLLPKTIAQSLKPAYKSKVVATDHITKFTDALGKQFALFEEKESEENQKKFIVNFLENAFYSENYINTKGRNDTVIRHGKNPDSPVAVIIEAKRAKAVEMVSMVKPNVKALHELIWYYFKEREFNNEICHLIATDSYDWYIFDDNDFDRLFYHETSFKKLYKTALNHPKSSEWFYEEAKKLLVNLVIELPCNCISIRDFVGKNLEKRSKTELANVYKILSPEHLLKLSFKNDANQLNQGFYRELLHIIGLEEAKDDASNKKIIRRVKDLSQRHEGSLLENTLSELIEDDSFKHLLNPDSFGQSLDEQFFSVSLELCITWLNRILFLKLLESQLITYHKNDKNRQFLTPKLIQDYNLLNELFFAVLARSPEKRSASTNKHFGNIPYLNSSLFEQTDLEDKTLTINQLKNRLTIPYFAQTVLKDDSGKRSLTGEVPTLTYLLEFLNAYHFGSDDTGELIQDRPKDLISASVLGLIFEKLNGYKDGSFFTPSFITMYMCHQSIRRAVVEKMSILLTDGFKDFEDLLERLDYADKDTRLKANQLINSLHICDPAVGSGHFLVSALNELIQIKYDLKILSYKHSGKRIDKDWKIEIDNDELRITDKEEGNIFVYNPQNEDSQALQETFFHEKQTLIENCLFGVDINPKSVSICRLRLWIELLKNAYYLPQINHLQVLPNIDINIKTGNSLVSRFGLDTDLSKALRSVKYNITQYRGFVEDYKNANNKELKQGLEKLIADIKGNFRTEIVKYSNPKILVYHKLTEELYFRFDGNALFGSKLTEKQKLERNNLTEKINKLKAEIGEQQNAKIYQNAFEWRFEFPEVLDDKGNFLGFDVVVGNPPYIRQERLDTEQKQLWFKAFKEVSNSTADIYVYFFGLGQKILKNKGFLSFITLNKWLKTKYGDSLRIHLSDYKVEHIIDFFELNVFEEASTDSAITFFQNELINNEDDNYYPSKYFPIKTLKGLNLNQTTNGSEYLKIEKEEAEWKFVSINDQPILRKFEDNTIPLKDYVNEKMYMGIKTAANEVFIISDELKEELCQKDLKSIEIIRPYLRPTEFGRYCYEGKKEWLINSHNGIVLNREKYKCQVKEEDGIKYYMPNQETKIKIFRKEKAGTTSFRINRIDVESDYPAVFEYMKSHESKLKKREDKGNQWTNLRNCDYIFEFDKPKITYVYTAKSHNFYLDYDKYLINNSSYMIVSEDKYLLAFLNSKLFEWFKKIKFVAFGDAEVGGRVKLDLNKMQTVPIKELSPEAQKPFIEKVDAILAIKKVEVQSEDVLKKCLELELEIDEMVFDLYDLTMEQREIIRGVF